jgi:hypothetical protein
MRKRMTVVGGVPFAGVPDSGRSFSAFGDKGNETSGKTILEEDNEDEDRKITVDRQALYGGRANIKIDIVEPSIK